MIATIITVGLALAWLGCETDWMRVRLLVGARTPIVKLSKRKCQFLKFGEDCIMMRRDIIKAQKSKAKPKYNKPASGFGYDYSVDSEIELLVDGKSIASINGDFKRGMIKPALKPYTTKARIGRKSCIIPVGEADRVNRKGV